MGVKRSFKQILMLMANRQIRIRSLSAVMMLIMTLQLAAAPVSAALWPNQTEQESGTTVPEEVSQAEEPALKNTYALVVSTGGQNGDSIQYFKVVYEDIDGIRRTEYILSDAKRRRQEPLR